MTNSKIIDCAFQIPVLVAGEGGSSCFFSCSIDIPCFLLMWMELNHNVQMPLDQKCI